MAPPASNANLRLVTTNDDAVAFSHGDAAEFLRAVIDSSPDCVKVIELDGTLSFMNSNGCGVMEIDDFCMVNGKKWCDLWPESARPDVLNSIERARKGEQTVFEAFCPTAKGAPRWWEVSVAPIHGNDGDVRAIVSTSRDVTERVHRENRLRLQEMEMEALVERQALELREKDEFIASKDIQLREVDHRTKNSLAMLTALLRTESRLSHDEEARDKIAAAASRVASIAAVHEHLYLNGKAEGASEEALLDVAPYLNALCRDLASSIPGTEVETECTPLALRGSDAALLGMLVSELVMNSARHGENGDKCTIRVELHDDGKGMRCLTVSDNGRGLPDGFLPANSTGLGMKVVTNSANRLGGRMTFGNTDSGAFFKVTF